MVWDFFLLGYKKDDQQVGQPNNYLRRLKCKLGN
jgi:hypothetical protein